MVGIGVDLGVGRKERNNAGRLVMLLLLLLYLKVGMYPQRVGSER